MIPVETWVAYTTACALVILAPGPDNILAISRGLSQGRLAAWLSSAGAGFGLMVHVFAAVLGLAVLIQTSATAFSIVKIAGAGYLIWLGIKAFRSKSLITFSPRERSSLRSVFLTGFLTNVLNPKPAFFVMAFVPQFVSSESGPVVLQTLALGVWFAVMAFAIFAVMGSSASLLARWLERRPRITVGLNMGAGVTFILAGLSVAFLERRVAS